jgi:hypothetical protein
VPVLFYKQLLLSNSAFEVASCAAVVDDIPVAFHSGSLVAVSAALLNFDIGIGSF